ncbi:MAG: hypothetical protein R3F43_31705 [bacterium]
MSGRLWALQERAGEALQVTQLTTADSPSSFGTDAAGQVYVTSFGRNSSSSAWSGGPTRAASPPRACSPGRAASPTPRASRWRRPWCPDRQRAVLERQRRQGAPHRAARGRQVDLPVEGRPSTRWAPSS